MAQPYYRQYDRNGKLIQEVRSGSVVSITALGAMRFIEAGDNATTAELRYTINSQGASINPLKNIYTQALSDAAGGMFDGKYSYLGRTAQPFGEPQSLKMADWNTNNIDTYGWSADYHDIKWQKVSLGAHYRYGNRYLQIDSTNRVAGSKIHVYAKEANTIYLVRSVDIGVDDAYGVCTDGKNYYVTARASNIYVYDLNGNTIRVLITSGAFQNWAIDYDGKYFWCIGS
jgi:hypothetical protein